MHPALNSYEYPRTYRLSRGWQLFLIVAGIGAVSGGVVGACIALRESRPPSSAITLFIVCAAFIVFGLYCVLATLRSHVVLYADRIEDHGLFVTRELQRDNILGRRLLQQRSLAGTVVLVPRDQGRQIKIATALHTDQAFREWISSLPDLDAQDRKAALDEIAGTADGSFPREDRLTKFTEQRKLAKQVTIVAYAIAAWGWFYPRPYNLVVIMLILLPWLALFLIARSPGFYRINKARNDAHLTLDNLIVLPPLILSLRVLSDMHPVQWKPVLTVSIVVGLAFCIAAAKIDPALRAKPVNLTLIAMISLVYGYGAGMQMNSLLDRSAPMVYRAVIVHKHISSGSRHTNYDLTLGTWGPNDERGVVSVPYSLYRSVSVNDTVCVYLRTGALKVSWYTVQRCEK